jgi:SdpC family antimicrobial peptide
MRSRTKKLVVAASATALLFAGTTPGHAANAGELANHQTPAAATQATFTGEDLFTGLLLGYGPVVDQHQELAEFITQLTDTIDQLDPTFFDTFAADITSGNPVHVDRAFHAGGDLLQTVLTDHFGASITHTIDDQSGTCVLLVVVAWVVTAGAVTAAGTVNVGVNINVAYNVNYLWNVSSAPDKGTGLAYEKWIHQVTEALAS